MDWRILEYISVDVATAEQFIESEGSALQLLLRKCNNRYHSFKTNDPAQATRLLGKIEWMLVENSALCLNARETAKWEEEETVTELISPPGESLVEAKRKTL